MKVVVDDEDDGHDGDDDRIRKIKQEERKQCVNE